MWTLGALGVVVVMELMTLVFFQLVAGRFLFSNPDRYVATPEELERARLYFDPVVGWKPRYLTAFGERPRAQDRGRPLVSVFGDSFTHGDEVAHEQTWAESLGDRLQGDVFNFGVGAYGIDQAALRFEEMAPRVPTPVVILAFISADIERNLCAYLKFLMPESNFSLTKPRFVLRDQKLVLQPNPIRTIDGLDRLRDPSFVRRLGEEDGIYNRYELPTFRFPYLSILATKPFWKSILRRYENADPWLIAPYRELTEKILLRFHEGAAGRGAMPVIVHLPVVDEMLQVYRHGADPHSVAFFRKMCARHAWTCLTPVDAARHFDEPAITELFTQGLDGGHYTPQGHRFIADRLAETVTGLLPAGTREPATKDSSLSSQPSSGTEITTTTVGEDYEGD